MNLWATTGFWLCCGAAAPVERKARCGRGVLWCTTWKFWWVWRGECPGALLDLSDGLSPMRDGRDGFQQGSVCLWYICSAKPFCGFLFPRNSWHECGSWLVTLHFQTEHIKAQTGRQITHNPSFYDFITVRYEHDTAWNEYLSYWGTLQVRVLWPFTLQMRT